VNIEVLERKFDDASQKLGKWRSWFAGWQLGTRSDRDAECAAVKDHREITIFLRAEVNALTKVLLDQKVMTLEFWTETLLKEVEDLDHGYSQRFPGVRSSLDGLVYDLAKVRETMQRMNFRP
jgi:hypothetical protein